MKIKKRKLSETQKNYIRKNSQNFSIGNLANRVKAPKSLVRSICDRERLPYIKENSLKNPYKPTKVTDLIICSWIIEGYKIKWISQQIQRSERQCRKILDKCILNGRFDEIKVMMEKRI